MAGHFFHPLVSTYLGGHLMPKLTQLQKVRGKSRLRSFRKHCLFLEAQAVFGQAINQVPVLRHSLTQLTQLHRQNCIRWNSTTAQYGH